jgi:hypothetical protein
MNKIALAVISLFGGLLFAQEVSAGEVLEDVVERRFPLDPSGTFSLRAIDGTVEIFGSDSREVKIVATKRAFSLERLNAIVIRVEARPDAVNIETTPPPTPPRPFSDRSGTVEYTINIPQTARIARLEMPNGELVIDGMRGASIAASLGRGQLVIHNCFCDQTIHVIQGRLNVFFDWMDERPFAIEAEIDDGNVLARLPTDATFQLHAAAREGHVSSDFSPIETRERADASEINEVIGDTPAAKLSFRASEGNIHISEVIW